MKSDARVKQRRNHSKNSKVYSFGMIYYECDEFIFYYLCLSVCDGKRTRHTQMVQNNAKYYSDRNVERGREGSARAQLQSD